MLNAITTDRQGKYRQRSHLFPEIKQVRGCTFTFNFLKMTGIVNVNICVRTGFDVCGWTGCNYSALCYTRQNDICKYIEYV
jgi:hypothetical protein